MTWLGLRYHTTMSNSHETVCTAVIGVGRMGRHHAQIYGHLAGARLVAVVDRELDRAASVAAEHGCDSCASVGELLGKHPELQAVSIAVPTPDHSSTAQPLLARGIACLIEKPLATSSVEAQRIVECAAEHDAILQVGHVERFNPAVLAVADMRINARFLEIDRVSPMSFRSLDIGVVMDLMIHDLDIVLMLADTPLVRVDASGVAVVGEHEDVANARLVFASGCVANLTASRLALKTERKLRIFSETAYVSLDYQRRSGIVIRKQGNELALEQLREQLASGADLSNLDYTDLVSVEPLSMDNSKRERDPLTAELVSFIGCVRDQRPPTVDGAAGCAAIAAAEQVSQAIREHRWEGLATPSP